MNERDIQNLEIDLLVQGIHKRYGHNFSQHARPTLVRRIRKRMGVHGCDSVSELLATMLRDENAFDGFLADMSITVTEMFRDPEFFHAFRTHVIPELRERSTVKIWHAGCATGEEVHSMAILLHEEDCLDRCLLFGTDCNSRSLAMAKQGIIPAERMREHAANYYAAGGKAAFSDYYRAAYGHAKIAEFLLANTTCSYHNLVEGGPLADIDVVVCRNVLIYFDSRLRVRVVRLLRSSLSDRGFLCLGSSEAIDETAGRFDVVSAPMRIYSTGVAR